MRPVLLTLCGWGPYKEKAVIDFRKFKGRNIFLITGQTGAGKTTVFDALTYALYGTLSGDVRDKGTVRSDFADENTKTYVELIMTHKSETYKIYRNPEYQRPKKRKTGVTETTKEKENAILTMPDNSIIAGNNDVTLKIQEILCMDVRQFKQISMIAQGDFARMIMASPSEKTAIFREIFATSTYAKLQEILKDFSQTLYREFLTYKNKMEEDIHMLSIDTMEWNEIVGKEAIDFMKASQCLENLLVNEKQIIDEKEEKEDIFANQILGLHKEKALAEQINQQFSDYEKMLFKSKQLEQKARQINELSITLNKIEHAQNLLYEEKSILKSQENYNQKVSKITKLKEEIKELEDKISSILPLYMEREKILKEYDQNQRIIEIRENLNQQVQVQKKELKDYEKVQLEYKESQEILDQKRIEYEEAESNYRKSMVGIVAKMVRCNEPCPVCGSLNHPKIVTMENSDIDEEYLKRLKENFNRTDKECNQLYESAIQYKKANEVRERQICDLANNLNELILKQDDQSKFIKDYFRKEGFSSKDIFERKIEQFQSFQGAIEEKKKLFFELEIEVRNGEEEMEEKKKDFSILLTKAKFQTKEEYRDCLNSVRDIEYLKTQISDYGEEKAAISKMLIHLENAIKDKERVKIDFLTDDISKLEKEKEELTIELKKHNVYIDQMKRSLKGIKDNWKKSIKISKEYGIVKDLDDLANGNNPKRLVFEQYVLAGYFERILLAANLRLYSMTDGRYEMRRALQVTDGRKKDNLEIIVMDFYTGKERPVKTLSGGETFKASLALALGMSDCIQAQSGGVQVETLFIDEGFGALDEESLNQACNTLQSLAESNKLIGIISHVQELRERIDNQIFVEKRNAGSFLKLIY